MSNQNNIIYNKGFIFVGCSFTWGFGLGYYYKNFDKKKYWDNYGLKTPHYNITKPHLMYQYSKRFSDLVANHFKTFKIQPDSVSGSDVTSTSWLKKIFKLNGNIYEKGINPFGLGYDLTNPDNSLSDYDVCIFQTSYVDRVGCHFYNQLRDEDNTYFSSHQELIDYWDYVENNQKLKNNLEYELTNLAWEEVKSTCIQLEEKGVKVYFIHIDSRYDKINDTYLKERTIPIEYNNKEYLYLHNLIYENESSLIGFDYEYFGEDVPNDLHPNLKLHDSISKSIIKRLEYESNKTNN